MKEKIDHPVLGEQFVGSYVIVRSANEGVNAGYLHDLDETGVIITTAQRLWSHKPKDHNMAWYEGVALSGLSDDSKISAPVPVKIIIEPYSITVCTSDAEDSIRGHTPHKQI